MRFNIQLGRKEGGNEENRETMNVVWLVVIYLVGVKISLRTSNDLDFSRVKNVILLG